MPRHPDLRATVLTVAAEIVATEGPDALSLREVARRAGVSHQAPYRHFDSREAVLATLATEGFAGLADALEAAEQEDLDAHAVDSARAYVGFALASPGHYRVMFRPDMVRFDGHPMLYAQSARAWEALRALAVRLADDGRIVGDEETAMAWLWSLVHGLASLLLDGPLPARGSTRSPEALVASVAKAIARPSAGP